MSAVMVENGWSNEGTVSDEELTMLALADDPDVTVDGDAISVWDLLVATDEAGPGATLPEWYRPAPLAGARPLRRRWHRPVAILVIASFVVINALGLCITYGQLVAA